MDLEEYLLKNHDRQVIDHAVRFHLIDEDGHPVFYIHPANTSGDTIDFTVRGNSLELKVWQDPEV